MERKRRDLLLGKLEDLDQISGEVEGTLRSSIEQSVQNRDIEGRLSRFVTTLQDDSQLPKETWDLLDRGVSARVDATRLVRAQLSELTFLTHSAQANVVSVSTATANISDAIMHWPRGVKAEAVAPPMIPVRWSSEQTNTFNDLRDGIKQAFAYKDALPELLVLITKLGVDKAFPGNRTAADHFEAARRAFDQPPGGTTSPPGVLVELRGGLNELLEHLRRRLVGQDLGKSVSQRILNIGNRAAYQIYGTAHFQAIAGELDRLEKELTEAKNAKMTREEVREVLNAVFYNVRLLLSSVDPSRLRQV